MLNINVTHFFDLNETLEINPNICNFHCEQTMFFSIITPEVNIHQQQGSQLTFSGARSPSLK